MSKGEANPKRSERNIRGVQVFVALGLMIGLLFIIAGGWLVNSENRDATSSTAQLRTTPKAASTTGAR